MNVVLVSDDTKIKNTTFEIIDNKYDLVQYSGSAEPLEVISRVCISNPQTIIIDDDFLKPNSAQVLSSIRSFLPEVNFIFITSDSSIELGRKISPIGVYFYAIKPVPQFELVQLLKSVKKDSRIN
jgi:DNA-binding NarL/FixJ family response regulator